MRGPLRRLRRGTKMDNKGQYSPVSRWFTGLFLLLVVVVAYGFFSGIVETTLPTANINAGINQQGREVSNNVASQFPIGMMGLGVAYLLYIFIAGLPGQQEDTPI